MLNAKDDYDEPADLEMAISVDGAEGEWQPFAKTASVSFAETEGEHIISVRFRDAAGNTSEPVSLKVVYDITPPDITLAYAPEERTRNDVTVTGKLSDGDWISESSHTFSTNGEYTFQAKDAAGNTSSKKAEVTWIDRTAPDFTLCSDQADSAPHKTASFAGSGGQ